MFGCCVTSPETQVKKKTRCLLGNLNKFDEDLQQWLQEAISQCQLIEHQRKNEDGLNRKTTDEQSDAMDIGLVIDDSAHSTTKDCNAVEDRSTIIDVSNDIHLFPPISSCPVPFKGRQTYRMWKAMIEMSESFIFKTHIIDIPKTLHFFPLETFQIPNLDHFCIDGLNFLQFMVKFLQVFFPGMTVILEDLFDINEHMSDTTSRLHSITGKKQFLVGDLYGNLHKATSVPIKHYILGFTWTDLYPKEELNFVLGEASAKNRCAVLSFGRFEPKTYKVEQEDLELQMDGALLWQLLRVASHETSHLFGIQHCVFFSCAMNESKSVQEALEQPLFLCPVCLRKLQRFLGFDIRERYSDLLDLCTVVQNVYPSRQLQRSVQWLQNCLSSLSNPINS